MTGVSTLPVPTATPPSTGRIAGLRAIAYRGLAQMYRPADGLFAFRARRAGAGVRLEGVSRRYTAMVVLGLADEPEVAVREILAGATLDHVCDELVRGVPATANLGDAAVTHWALVRAGHGGAAASRRRLLELLDGGEQFETVELAWALTALSAGDASQAARRRDEAARRLMGAFVEASSLFPHRIGAGGFRSHVCCYADLVYPVVALSRYHVAVGDARALRIAQQCAARMCTLQGPAGQWWWHYDVRTGRILERYPVYAVHQDAMGPMALFALAEAGGASHAEAVRRGLNWLDASPELDGGTLIDAPAGMIWRKVARREPRKLVRKLQAVTSAIHPSLRWPLMDVLFPAGAIDDECRPYHLGWLLYAWPAARAAQWDWAGVA